MIIKNQSYMLILLNIYDDKRQEIVRRTKSLLMIMLTQRGSSKAGRLRPHQSKREKKIFLIMMANKAGTVYRRIQEKFPSLRVFSLRLRIPFGKMFFRVDTHC